MIIPASIIPKYLKKLLYFGSAGLRGIDYFDFLEIIGSKEVELIFRALKAEALKCCFNGRGVREDRKESLDVGIDDI